MTSPTVALLWGLGLLSGCGAAIPPSTTGSQPAIGSSRPAPPAASAGESLRLTLDDALAYAAAHAPTLELARHRAARGDAEVEAAAPLLPDNPVVTVALGGRATSDGHHLEMLYGLEQSFEIAGQRRLRGETAERVRDAYRAGLVGERWRLEQDVRCAFYGALLAGARVTAAERLVAFSEQVVTVTRRQIDAGDIPEVSILLAQSDLAQARQAQVAARLEVDRSRLTLAELIGLPPGVELELLGEPCPARAAPAVEQLVDLALESHPAWRGRELALAAAESRVELEDREAWPEPALGVSYSREGADTDNPQLWLVTLGLPLPFWQRNQGGRARARADLSVARADVELWRSTLSARLERAARAVDAAAERVAIYGTDIVPRLERNLSQIQRAYELGELNINQVSQTRQRVLTSEQAALDALQEYFRAAAELQTLTGAEVWSHAAEPVAAEEDEQ